MSSTDGEQKKIMLKSSDGETFELEEAAALQSQLFKHMIEDNCADTIIPVPKVNSKILAKVIKYCKRHVEAASGDEVSIYDLKMFDADFVQVDHGTLIDLILAANYLHIQSLLDLTCQTVAYMIKGKTAEEIHKMFDIKNDFTPYEEAKEVLMEKSMGIPVWRRLCIFSRKRVQGLSLGRRKLLH